MDGAAGLRVAEISEPDERLDTQFHSDLCSGEGVVMDAHRSVRIFENALWDSRRKF